MADDDVAAAAADAQRRYWGRVLAATLRMARDLDIAEEATADAFALALQTWPDRGVPDSVEAWLLTAARRRALDRIRRLARFRERLAAIAATGDLAAQPADALARRPARARRRAAPRRAVLPPGARPGGPGRPDHAPRVWRADGVGRRGLPRPGGDDGGAADPGEEAHRRVGHRHRASPTTSPSRSACRRCAARSTSPTRWATPPARARHSATTTSPTTPSASPGRCTPCDPTTPRRPACWRCVLLTEARAGTRIGGGRRPGAARRRRPHAWDRALIAEGLALVAALRRARSARPAGGDRRRARRAPIVRGDRLVGGSSGCYDALLTVEPSPTIALGRCVAISYAAGPEAGLADLDEVLALGGLDAYPYAHAARAQMLDRLGRAAEAAESWAAAGRSARTDAERAFFAARQA